MDIYLPGMLPNPISYECSGSFVYVQNNDKDLSDLELELIIGDI